MLKRYTHEKDGYLRESDSGEWVKYDDIGKNALEPVATVTVRSIGGDTVDTIPGRDYVLAQDAAAIIAQYSIRDGALRAQLEFFTTSVDDERSLRIRFEQRVVNLRAQLAAKDAELKLAWQTNTEVILREQLTATQSRITELEKEAEENARIIGMSGEREAKHLSMIEQQYQRIAELEAALAVRYAYPQAHRLAMELECFMLSCTDTAVTAKWWDSANEALEQWREFNAAQGADALKGAPAEKGGAA